MTSPLIRFNVHLSTTVLLVVLAWSATAENSASPTQETDKQPTSPIRWQTSAPGSLKPDGDGMVLTPSGGPMMVWGFFAPAGSPVALKVGEGIRLSFSYTYSNPGNRFTDFRIGLFHFGSGPRPSGRTFVSPDLKGYFFASGTQQANPAGSRVYTMDNTGSTDGALNHKSEKAAPVGAPFPAINAGTETHIASLTIKRTGEDSVDVTASVDADNDASFTSPDSTLKLPSFDCAAMFFGRMNEDDNLIISNLKVEVVP